MLPGFTVGVALSVSAFDGAGIFPRVDGLAMCDPRVKLSRGPWLRFWHRLSEIRIS